MKHLLKTLLLIQLSFSAFAQNGYPPEPDYDEIHQNFCALVPCHNSCMTSDSYYCDEKSLEAVMEKPESNLVSSKAGDLHVVEMNTKEMKTVHFSYKSKMTDELISAVLTVPNSLTIDEDFSKTLENLNQPQSLANYVFKINMNKGQLIFTKDTVSVLTSGEFSQTSLNEYYKNEYIDEDFKILLESVIGNSEFEEFNALVSESGMSKSWGCAGSLIALAGANLALAGALAATYATVGAASAAIGAATAAVGGAIAAVGSNCGYDSIE